MNSSLPQAPSLEFAPPEPPTADHSPNTPDIPTQASCAVETTLKIIGGRWKVLILKELFAGTQRFSALNRALPGITQKMLTQQLRELEQDGIVHREVYQQVPPRVEYSLTAVGQTLYPVLVSMHHWGQTYLNATQANTANKTLSQ